MGSSANTTVGSVARARAQATRCCCPPDSSAGRCFNRSAIPTACTNVLNRSREIGRLAMSAGSLMFSSAFSVGMRLKDWKMKPILSRRSRVSLRSLSFDTVTSSRVMVPSVMESKPARQCMRVDLPEPDGPMMAVNSPRPICTSTPRRACTAASPLPYILVTLVASTTTSAGDSIGCKTLMTLLSDIGLDLGARARVLSISG